MLAAPDPETARRIVSELRTATLMQLQTGGDGEGSLWQPPCHNRPLRRFRLRRPSLLEDVDGGDQRQKGRQAPDGEGGAIFVDDDSHSGEVLGETTSNIEGDLKDASTTV